jgi:hypothetical protein
LEGAELEGLTGERRRLVLHFINRRTGEAQKQGLPGPGMGSSKAAE